MEYKEFFNERGQTLPEDYTTTLHNQPEIIPKEEIIPEVKQEVCQHCKPNYMYNDDTYAVPVTAPAVNSYKSGTIIDDISGLVKTIMEATQYLTGLYMQFKNFNIGSFLNGFSHVFEELKDEVKDIAKGVFGPVKTSELKIPKFDSELDVKHEIVKIESGLMQTLIKLHRMVDGNPAFKWITKTIDGVIARIKKLV